jgi:selenide,water dikinase
MANMDDAGVYKVTEDIAIIQTIDFFTPVVDDPYTFGQIAAANALSDVYAKGGKPLTAMNVVCFPAKSLDISVLKKILRGGLDKMLEAGATLVGGHSVEDAELKYGLSVTGTVHPECLVTNSGAKAQDKLVLTKPLGNGIINTALKAGLVNEGTAAKVIESMATLNKKASEVMQAVGVHGCTDITGFGLLGHAYRMADNSQVNFKIRSALVPFFPEAVEFAHMGLCPGGLHRNKEFYSPMVEITSKIPEHVLDILFDTQTSGGLLISVAPEKAQTLLDRLHGAGVPEATIIGEVTSSAAPKILVE